MFHVPEKYRIIGGRMGSNASFGNRGAFTFAIFKDDDSRKRHKIHRVAWVIASDGMGWEHVSVHMNDASGKTYTPTWDEMCFVKDMFWDDEDCVMQLHPPRSLYVNNHPNVLHLWRPTTGGIPIPNDILVGIRGLTPQDFGVRA